MTISASQYCHVLPCELAGWVVRRLQLQADVPWLLVITTDPSARLAAALLTRLTALTNCVCGFSDMTSREEDVHRLSLLGVETIIPMVVEIDVLVPVSWSRHVHHVLWVEGGQRSGHIHAHDTFGRSMAHLRHQSVSVAQMRHTCACTLHVTSPLVWVACDRLATCTRHTARDAFPLPVPLAMMHPAPPPWWIGWWRSSHPSTSAASAA